MIMVKRIYDKHGKKDGFRILVDRLWPRGLSKERARVDVWLRDVSPSDNVRKWFAHDPEKWEEFRNKYKKELGSKSELLHKIKKLEKERGAVTLLYSAKDEKHNNAVVLKEILQNITETSALAGKIRKPAL